MKPLLPLLLLLPLLGGCGTMADPREWFGSDSGPEPSELQPIETRLAPQSLFEADVGEGARRFNRLVPAVDGDNLYTIDTEGHLQARDRFTGRLHWEVATGLPASGGPGAADGILAVGTQEGDLVVFDQANGAELWRKRLSSEILSVPAIGNGLVVVHTEDGNLYGLDAGGGEQRWLYRQRPPVLSLHGTASPVISGTTLFCGLAGGKLVALNLETGALEWEGHVTIPAGRTELERMVDVDADPLVYNGTLYAAAYQGDVVAVGEGSGKVFWKRKLSSYNNMAVNWQQLVVSDDQGRLWSLDPDTGSARWRVESLRYRQLSPPAILGDYVVVGDFEGYLHWFAADDGAPVARQKIAGGAIVAQPRVVDDEILYVLATDGTLAALKLPAAQ